MDLLHRMSQLRPHLRDHILAERDQQAEVTNPQKDPSLRKEKRLEKKKRRNLLKMEGTK